LLSLEFDRLLVQTGRSQIARSIQTRWMILIKTDKLYAQIISSPFADFFHNANVEVSYKKQEKDGFSCVLKFSKV